LGKYTKKGQSVLLQIEILVFLPASYTCIHAADGPVFMLSELAMFDIGPQVVQPSKPTALSTSSQPFNHSIEKPLEA
jgi:hypothetical protein